MREFKRIAKNTKTTKNTIRKAKVHFKDITDAARRSEAWQARDAFSPLKDAR